MQYTHFEITNFKGIRNLRLDLGKSPKGRVYSLVGLNESGKTTVLEAIDLFTAGTEALDPKDLAGRIRPDPNDLVPISERANFNGEMSIAAGVELSDDDLSELTERLRKKTGFKLAEFSRSFVVRDVYNFTKSTYDDRRTFYSFTGSGRGRGERRDWDFKRQKYPEEVREAISALREMMPPIWYFPNFLFEFPDRIFLRPQANESAKARFYRTLLQDVLDALNLKATVEEHMLERALSNDSADRRALDDVLLKMGRQITNDVFSAWNRIFDRQVVNKRVVLQCGSEEVAGEAGLTQEPYVVFQIEDADGFFFVRERSLGFRWFFVFLLLTTYRAFRSNTSAGLIFLFDEPASNLHPSAQMQLLSSLEKLGERSRVIYTTHSHYLINPDWLEQTFVVRNLGLDAAPDELDYTAKQTNIAIDRYRSFAAAHPEQSQYFQPILDVLDVAPSRLDLVPDVAMLEGKNDYYACRVMERVLARVHQPNLLPGGGAGSLDHLIALYLGWGRRFVVLLDSDREGVKQRDRYLERFGSVLEGRLFVLGDLVPELASKPLDDAFSTQDRDELASSIGRAEPVDDKKSFYRVLQEVLATQAAVQLSDESRDVFARLLGGLASALVAATE